MSAELLREAAADMRRRAEDATPGRWACLWDEGQHALAGYWVAADGLATVAVTCEDIEGVPARDAAYIAGMQPAVALAVAEWLEAKAEQDDKGHCDAEQGVCNHCESDYGNVAALHLARTYLGRES